MKRREKTDYQAKVIKDGDLTRGRVPTPVLNAMGARPGDYISFHLTGPGKATMSIVRTKKSKSRK
jgi:hypothetical protein